MNEDYAVIGAPGGPWSTIFEGAAYIYKRDSSIWIQDTKLLADDWSPLDYFGESVSISGDYVIVGAPQDNDMGSYSGSAYIFKRNGLAWSQYIKFTAGDGETFDRFGSAVSLNSEFAVIGAPDDDDNGFNSGSAYIYGDFIAGINENILKIPIEFRLEQNYPNPFNPVTKIEYSIAKTAKVEIIVFDILGREVAKLVNETKKAGNHEVNFDASKYSSGLYFYKINAGEYSHVKRMLLLK